MAWRNSLVAKHTPDLVDALEPTDKQPLQVELERDAQIQISIECVVVSQKRSGVTTTRDLLKHGRLHLQEPPLVVEMPDGGDDPGARAKDLAHARVCDQVDVALPVPDLDVLQPVPLVGQGPVSLGQQLEGVNLEGRLATARRKHRSTGADDVSGVELHKPIERLGSQDVPAGEQLDATNAVLEVGERGSAMQALDHDPPGKRYRVGPVVCLSEKRLGALARVRRTKHGDKD